MFGLMDFLGIKQAYLGGGAFGAAISLGCAARGPEPVRAIFPSNIAGGIICQAFLTAKLFRSVDMAMDHGISSVLTAFDLYEPPASFRPEIAQSDSKY